MAVTNYDRVGKPMVASISRGRGSGYHQSQA